MNFMYQDVAGLIPHEYIQVLELYRANESLRKGSGEEFLKKYRDEHDRGRFFIEKFHSLVLDVIKDLPICQYRMTVVFAPSQPLRQEIRPAAARMLKEENDRLS